MIACRLVLLGNGVADPSISEFSCPTCRRLANILLPDVDASISSKRIDLHDDVKGVAETRQEWSGFWQANNNLKSAMECFCHQVRSCHLLLQTEVLTFDMNFFCSSCAQKCMWMC